MSTHPSEPLVTAVIVTYQSMDTVCAALSALRQGHDLGMLRCVVVDNYSVDGTADLVARDHPWSKLIRSLDNIGYGRGCNLGFQHVETPYVLLMNPDVVISPDAISRMVTFMEKHPSSAMVAPATEIASGEFQHIGGLPTPWRLVLRAAGFYGDKRRQHICPGTKPVLTDWLCGAIMLVRSSVFRDLGGFDPRFFLYFEETDLCIRIRQTGGELWCIGDAVAFHSVGASSRKVNPMMGGYLPQHFFPSRYYYLAKHHGGLWTALSEAAELPLLGLRDMVRLLLFKNARHDLRTRLRGPIFTRPPPVP